MHFLFPGARGVAVDVVTRRAGAGGSEHIGRVSAANTAEAAACIGEALWRESLERGLQLDPLSDLIVRHRSLEPAEAPPPTYPSGAKTEELRFVRALHTRQTKEPHDGAGDA